MSAPVGGRGDCLHAGSSRSARGCCASACCCWRWPRWSAQSCGCWQMMVNANWICMPRSLLGSWRVSTICHRSCRPTSPCGTVARSRRRRALGGAESSARSDRGHLRCRGRLSDERRWADHRREQLAVATHLHRPVFSLSSVLSAGDGGKPGRYFALGSTSGLRGYYFAHPIRDRGDVLGAVVVKVDMSNAEAHLANLGQEVLVTDPDGVVFISTRREWRFRTLSAFVGRRAPASAREPALSRRGFRAVAH